MIYTISYLKTSFTMFKNHIFKKLEITQFRERFDSLGKKGRHLHVVLDDTGRMEEKRTVYQRFSEQMELLEKIKGIDVTVDFMSDKSLETILEIPERRIKFEGERSSKEFLHQVKKVFEKERETSSLYMDAITATLSRRQVGTESEEQSVSYFFIASKPPRHPDDETDDLAYEQAYNGLPSACAQNQKEHKNDGITFIYTSDKNSEQVGGLQAIDQLVPRTAEIGESRSEESDIRNKQGGVLNNANSKGRPLHNTLN